MFYIIFGDDSYSCHAALNDIKAGLGSQDMVSVNTTVLDGRKLTTRALSDVCSVVPFMAPSRLVIVEGLFKRFQAGEKQPRANGGSGDDGNQSLKEWQGLSDFIKAMPESTVLVMFESDLDPRSANPLVKALSPMADKVLQLSEMKGRELTAWIKDHTVKNDARISAAAVALLADYVGGDLWSLSGELNKLMTYCQDREISETDVREITSFARE